MIGVGRTVLPIIAGEAAKRIFASKEKPAQSSPEEIKKEPETQPYSLSPVSSLAKFKDKFSKFKSSVKKRINESTDEPRVVEHFIMRNKNIKNKVLMPIYNTLKKLKEKNKYNKDVGAKHLYYVVNYALREMNSGDKKVTLSQIEKARVVNDLLRNFEKSFK